MLSQAFWYGIWAAILYFLDASLMAVTFWGALTGHYPRDFSLTNSQRTLMLQTIMFLMYLLIGALVFSTVEGWNYLDGVYWADVTLFTVGFGDYGTTSHLGRALLFPYALIGVISLGLVIGSIRSMVLERGKRRLDARMQEKNRRQTIRRMTMNGNDEVFEPVRELSRVVSSPFDEDDNENTPEEIQEGWSEYERRKAEFELMRKIQNQASIRRRWVAMGISTGSMVVLWLVGAVIFLEAERPYQTFSYYNAFYFCFVSFTTIGYGDVTPISPCGKSFFVFWSLLTLPAMTILISNAGDTVVAFIRDGTIRLGHITILPDEDGFEGNVKSFLHRVTCGAMFQPQPAPEVDKSRRKDERRPSAGGKKSQSTEKEEPNMTSKHPVDAQNNTGDASAHRGRALLDVERGTATERMASSFTARVRRSLSRLRDPFDDDLPNGTEFHFLLISEIKEICQHLHHKHPKRYTYEEWAWYLKLIGEDERLPDTHRKAKPKEDKTPIEDIKDPNDERLKWSWVGNRSPLMGGVEETEWILDRLTDRLRESLSFERKRQAQREEQLEKTYREKHKSYGDGDKKRR